MYIHRKRWRSLLWPFSLVYGSLTGIRNILFDLKVLKSVSFPIPVISVGNITVGGTGKTPHIEYLARLLQHKRQVAVLSRGYRRKTSDFRMVTSSSTPFEVGDEPCQVKQKFPDLIVAVDRQRVHGIRQLLTRLPQLEIILLDDAFQHRHVRPGLSILLIDYHRLITRDCLLPAGDLRETARNRYRSDCLLVTKCPADLAEGERAEMIQELLPQSSQEIYFTTFRYQDPVPVFPSAPGFSPLGWKKKNSTVFLITGIANPAPLISYLQGIASHIVEFTFPDHHTFSRKDLDNVLASFNRVIEEEKLVITTEKDATRLRQLAIPEPMRQVMYYLPVQIEFLFGEKDNFDRKISRYVGTD